MALNLAERIEKLNAAIQPVMAEDDMAEAGRKILLAEFVKMLQHETGSRTGEDIEDVHDMRVATRRMRSLFRLLDPYYKQNAIQGYKSELRNLASTLGAVRDLDVLIGDIRTYQSTLNAPQQADLQQAVDELDKQREAVRHELVNTLDSRLYNRLVKDFSKFLTTFGEGVKSVPKDEVVPIKVRHMLPIIIYQRVAAVRAYDGVLSDAEAPTLHALRIELKRLRYTLSLFSEVLGSQGDAYIEAVKGLQDCLGHMNDAVVARAYLSDFLKESHLAALTDYIASLEEKESALKGQLFEYWTQFNSPKVQQRLSYAVLALH